MLERLDITKVLIIDIETVPQYESYDNLPENVKLLWDKKAKYLKKADNDPSETLYERAGIYAEFGKIVCISCGYFSYSSDIAGQHLRIKSFYGENEKEILEDFSFLLNQHFNSQHHLLCAHNGKEFDFPYLARRMLIHGLALPLLLNIAGKKPWEIGHLDTMELWKFGDYKSYTSLELLAAVFNIPTPKDDIDGSQVGNVYWQDKDTERIATYCAKDVLTTAQILLKYKGEKVLATDQVVFV